MNILRWVIENWDNIIVVIALIAALVAGVIRFVKKWKAMTNEERIAYVKRLLENLLPSAIKFVTDAERTYGGGTGDLKRAEVMDKLYARIPDAFKPYITEANLRAVLESALDTAKVLWEENSAIHKLVTPQKSTKAIGFSANKEA
jgi:hypothetical protein